MPMLFTYLYMLLLCWLALMGTLGVLAMAFDKLAAIFSWRRVPEARLHALEWAGAAPAMVACIYLFQHKVAKGNYWHRSVLPLLLWCALTAGLYALMGVTF